MSTNEPPVEHEDDAYRNLHATMQRDENGRKPMTAVRVNEPCPARVIPPGGTPLS